MGTGISNYVADSLAEHIVGKEGFASPSALYLALGTALPDPSDTTSWSDELSGNGYQRAWIVFDGPFPADPILPETMEVRNFNYVVFPRVVTSSWSFAYYAIWDHQTNGKILCSGGFDSSQSVAVGEFYWLPPDQLTIQCNGVGVSKYLIEKVLDHVFRGNGFTKPDVYIAAMDQGPDWDKTGSQLDEPTAGGYQRASAAAWNDVSSGTVTNDGQVTFAAASGADWNKEINSMALCDAQSGGNMLGSGDLGSGPYSVNDGDVALVDDETLSLWVQS